jgi:hypothetical protein
VVQDEIDNRGLLPVGKLRGVAADGRADDREDARTDDRADAKRGKRNRTQGLLQRSLGLFAFGDQLVDGLRGEDLARLRQSLAGFGGRRQGGESSNEDDGLKLIVCGMPPRRANSLEARNGRRTAENGRSVRSARLEIKKLSAVFLSKSSL